MSLGKWLVKEGGKLARKAKDAVGAENVDKLEGAAARAKAAFSAGKEGDVVTKTGAKVRKYAKPAAATAATAATGATAYEALKDDDEDDETPQWKKNFAKKGKKRPYVDSDD